MCKHVRSLGLHAHFRDNERFRKAVRLIIAIARVPWNRMEQALRLVKNYAREQNVLHILQPLLVYVQRTWLPNDVARQRLSVHGQIHTTDNAAESFHSMLKKEAPVARPNFFDFNGK